MPFLRNPEDKDQKYRIVPAYLSIYDGFGMYAGAYTNGTYWEKPEITAQLAAGQFVMGAQMGFANMDLKPNPNITKG